MPCPPDHVEYLSEMLATNAVTLHRMRNPECTGIEWFSCDDHFHIGHHSRADKNNCVAHNTPIVYQSKKP